MTKTKGKSTKQASPQIFTEQPSATHGDMTNHSVEIEALFTSIGEGAITTDEFGRITRVNPMAIRLLGYKKQDLIGEWLPKVILATYFDGDPIDSNDRPISKAYQSGQSVTDSIILIRKDGLKLPVSLTVSPILYQGKTIGAIEVFRDITNELEIDRLKSEFISLASHQLRTPLSAIKTYSHMLAEGYMGDLNEKQQEAMHTVIHATDRMNTLISHLLSISRFENGTMTVKAKRVDISLLLKEAAKEVSVMAASKSINIVHKVKGSSSIYLKTDGVMIKEVIINLLSNSIKYTPAGGKVEIIMKPKLKDIVIEVKDDGWGIPTSDKAQIFTKFYRAHNIAKKETDGTGLGLYLVKGLLNSLGGTIWFESEENKGTSFYISLPRK